MKYRIKQTKGNRIYDYYIKAQVLHWGFYWKTIYTIKTDIDCLKMINFEESSIYKDLRRHIVRHAANLKGVLAQFDFDKEQFQAGDSSCLL